MSTIKALVPYQIETLGARPGRSDVPPRDARPQGAAAGGVRPVPRRETAFIVQLMAGSDPDLRRKLGRGDVAAARDAAYGAAMANRPSATGLRFLTDIGRI